MNIKKPEDKKVRKNYSIAPRVLKYINELAIERRLNATEVVEECVTKEYERTRK